MPAAIVSIVFLENDVLLFLFAPSPTVAVRMPSLAAVLLFSVAVFGRISTRLPVVFVDFVAYR